mmetsp:Transcript_80184/g.214768  ORF Transcript_80184/g.214768 Transcript_80184/m.214768 type:complete len:262 (+) Transcript_80184:301-1086(+)
MSLMNLIHLIGSSSLPPNQSSSHNKKFWLLKSEPDEYSIDDLASQPDKIGFWDGIRNFQARNFILRMSAGEQIFFYHSSCKTPAIVGIASVASPARPDPTALDPAHKYFDAGSDAKKPRWFGVDIKFEKKLENSITLELLKTFRDSELSDLLLLRNPRLSVQEVSKRDWDFILSLQCQQPCADALSPMKGATACTSTSKKRIRQPEASSSVGLSDAAKEGDPPTLASKNLGSAIRESSERSESASRQRMSKRTANNKRAAR